MTQTYREEQEADVGERIMEDLNKLVGANVFSIEEEMDDDSEIELETGDDSYPEGYDDNGFIN